ncbi:MAG: 23S rRNA (guanosine(2251)-2'-O)-methyltransferase RlmB [Flavobacteriaceae bacterium]|nr:23S rRNA (guanosine(2251)-2'-O)-methyltransferase RlmB [Flavobacteriaceae bacterium]
MENNQTLIFGIRAIIEAINSGKNLEKVYLQKELKGELIKELNFLIRKKNISSSFVPIEKLNSLSKHQNHQGAVARISSIKFEDLDHIIEKIMDPDFHQDKKIPLFLLLDQISDVRNLGAIIRTAECTGVDAIVIPTHGSAPINADAIKTSAGAAFKLPICKVDHILDAVYQLQAVDIQIVAVTEKTNTSLYDIDLTKPTALVMGSEHKGISNSILKISNAKGKIPLLGTIESLNVSVACGVALYEIVRQRIPF